MNRKEFLTQLNKGLSNLPERDRREIVKFYYDRISRGIKSGKTEEEAINDLDSISKIVRNILKEHSVAEPEDKIHLDNQSNIEKENNQQEPEVLQEEPATERGTVKVLEHNKKSSNLVTRLFSLFGLLVFDLLFTSWLIPVAVILVILALIISGILFVAPFAVLVTTYNIEIKASLIIGTIGMAILSTVLIKIAVQILKFIVQVVLNLHYNILSGRHNKRFKFNYGLNLKKGKYKVFIVLSILSIILSFATIIMNADNFIDNYYVEPDYTNEEYIEEIDISKTWNLIIDVPSSKLQIEFYDESEIKFVYDKFDGDELIIDVDDNTNTITYDHNQNWLSFIDINPYQQKVMTNVKVFIPNGIIINDLNISVSSSIEIEHDTLQVTGNIDLSSYNGDVVLSNIDANSISLYSYNGNITLLNIVSDNVSIRAYNGNITFADSTANDVYIKNYNGGIKLENVTAVIDEESYIRIINYNGPILLTDVYIANVHIGTYNGDISYNNENKDYKINFIEEPKSYNGEEYINI